MTTVAWRDGVMAADTQGNWDGLRTVAQKIYHEGNALIGYSGSTQDFLVFLEWWRAGKDMQSLPEFRMYRGESDAPDFNVIAATKTDVEVWTEHFQMRPLRDPFWALGTGAAAALAAMHMGADARQAVEIAMLVDVNTGGEIQVERLDGWRKATA